jgi:hypothetical protein
MSYKDDVSINKFALDFELQRQPELVENYGLEQAEAEFKRDKIKDQLDTAKADLFIDIKTNHADFGFDKSPTDSLTKSAVEINEKVIELKLKLATSNFSLNSWKASNRALSHKKSSLQGLYILFNTGYWSDAKVTAEEQNKYDDNHQDHYNQTIQNDERMLKRRKNHGKKSK